MGKFALFMLSFFLVLSVAGTVEVALRLFVGHSEDEIQRLEYSQFLLESKKPFFRRLIVAGNEFWQQVPRRRVQTNQRFSVTKGTPVTRIFVLGGSSALNLGKYLHARLNRENIAPSLEVINCAAAGSSLEQLDDRLRDVFTYCPDTILLLFGHNLSFVHPTLSGPTRWLSVTAQRSVLISWINTWLPKTELRMQRVSYQERLSLLKEILHRLIRRGNENGVRIYICTVPSNLWWPPASNADDHNEVQFLEGSFLAAQNKREMAIQTLEQALQYRPTALWHFQIAEWLYDEENYAKARRHFILARDLDGPRHRAPEAVNELLRETAQKSGVSILDFDSLITRNAPHGVPGWESFQTYVHPNNAGIARETDLFWNSLIQSGNTEMKKPKPPTFLPFPETTWHESHNFLENMAEFTTDYYTDWMQALSYRLRYVIEAGLIEPLKIEALADLPEIAPKHVDRETFRAMVLLRASKAFWSTGDSRTALSFASKAQEAAPLWEEPLIQSGLYHLTTGHEAQAYSSFLKALEINPFSEAAKFYSEKLSGSAS